MTDARIPERYLNDRRLNRLSDSDFRSYIMSLVWSVSNRTEGNLFADDLPLIPRFTSGAEVGIEESGLWRRNGQAWIIDRFEFDQSTNAQLEAADRTTLHNRERKRKQRARAKKPPVVDVTADVTRDITQDIQGQDRDRPGQARDLPPEIDHDLADSEFTEWRNSA